MQSGTSRSALAVPNGVWLASVLVTRRAGRKHDKSHSRSDTTSSDLPLFSPDWPVIGTPIPTTTTFPFARWTSLINYWPHLSNPRLQPTLTGLPFLGNSTNDKAAPDQSFCSCFAPALDLFSQLLSHDCATCTRNHCSSRSQSGGQALITDSIVTTNAQTVDVISHILHCLCAHGSFLFVLVFLIAFKVLDLYAAAARELSPDPTDPKGYDVAAAEPLTEDHARLTAQSVLSELHRMQKLINALPTKMKRYEPEERTGNYLVSSTVLHQLELDLRQQLRALSLEIVDILRR
ncbi:hypothetical protein AbraIFM66950_006923 [Aspergillus brasiliensis]|nr:hypothetical protein AbraIFM66950_006923 [Aspergillus brasiliensis]